MDSNHRIRRSVTIVAFLVWFVISFSLGSSTGFASADPEDAKETSKSSNQHWERVKSFIHQLQTKFFPPDIDFRSMFAPSDKGINEEGQNSAGATVKEAAEKSFLASKKTVEETAKSAAEVVEKAAHATAEKVKGKMSGEGSRDDSHNSEL